MRWVSLVAPLALVLVSCALRPPATPAAVLVGGVRAPSPTAIRRPRPPEPPPPPPSAASQRPGEAFDEETWMLLRSESTGLVEAASPGPDAGYVELLAGSARARGAQADPQALVSAARTLLVGHPDLFGVRDPAMLVPDGPPTVDDDGTTDVTFKQVVAGAEVLDATITVRVTKEYHLRAVNGSLRRIRRPVLPARLTAAQALARAGTVKTPSCGRFVPRSGALVVEGDGEDYALFYRVLGASDEGAAEVRVNARTGVATYEGSDLAMAFFPPPTPPPRRCP